MMMAQCEDLLHEKMQEHGRSAYGPHEREDGQQKVPCGKDALELERLDAVSLDLP